MNTKLSTDLPITIDPEIMGGVPVFRGTRVPVQTLFDYLADGFTVNEIIDEFPSMNRQDALRLLEAAPQLLAGLVCA